MHCPEPVVHDLPWQLVAANATSSIKNKVVISPLSFRLWPIGKQLSSIHLLLDVHDVDD